MNAPKKITWFISLIVGALSLVAHFVNIPFVTVNQYWFMGVAWLLLIVANFIKGL